MIVNLLQVLEKPIDKLKTELLDLACDILSMDGDEEALMEEESAIQKALFDMNLRII